MYTVKIHKASAMTGKGDVESIQILAEEEIPDIASSGELLQFRSIFEGDAEALFLALSHLPGGTQDALLRKMLEHRALSLRVRL